MTRKPTGQQTTYRNSAPTLLMVEPQRHTVPAIASQTSDPEREGVPPGVPSRQSPKAFYDELVSRQNVRDILDELARR